VSRLRQSADGLQHQRIIFTLYFIAAPAIFCWAGGQFGLKICFTCTRAEQVQKITELTTLARCLHLVLEATLSRMTLCHAIYLVIFAVSTCKASGHAGCEGLDTTPYLGVHGFLQRGKVVFTIKSAYNQHICCASSSAINSV
jgi:hypothetical protein